jgi:hypothetical protein
MNNIQSSGALFVLSFLALVPACDGGSSGSGGGAGGGTTSAAPTLLETLADCGLAGDFVVTSTEAVACGDWPAPYEVIAVEGDGDDVTLRAGLLVLPLAAGAGECVFVAKGCESVASDPGNPVPTRYFAPTLQLERTATGARITAEATDVYEGAPGPCGGAKVEIDAVPGAGGCGPLGTFAADAAPIQEGQCGLSWGPGEVSLTKDGAGYMADWAGTTMYELTFDQATCTLAGSKGVSPDYWSYNAAQRQAEISLVVSPQAVQGTVTDLLLSPTSDGVTCPGATFTLTARRPSREARALAPACDSAPPAVCGDSVCEAGESCQCAECACAGGQECVFYDKTCHSPCTLPTEAASCAAGERCSAILSDYKYEVFPSDTMYCASAGDGKKGDPCKATAECGAGLICHVPVFSTKLTCAEPCGPDFPACPANEKCGEAGDGSGQGSYPTAIRACEPG